jgi:hypothetical protein
MIVGTGRAAACRNSLATTSLIKVEPPDGSAWVA